MRPAFLISTAAALALIAVCAAAQADPAVTPPSTGAGDARSQGVFQRMDVNGDGRITRDEAGPYVKRKFESLDADHDGGLTADELRGARTQRGDGASANASGEDQASAAPAAREPRRRGSGPARRGGAMQSGEQSSASGTGARRRAGGGGAGVASAPVTVAIAGARPTAADVDAHMRAVVSGQGLDGAAVIVARFDASGTVRDVVRSYYGAYTPDTAAPIASATKWYTGALVEAVAESGALRLDAPISTYLPNLPADKRAITVRQTISHTSGLATFGPMQDRGHPTLADSAAAVLAAPLVGAPGTVLSYSGSAMQVGARVAEVASGKEWRALFAERIARPLDMAHTVYGVDTEHAPMTGGGINTTPRDMEAFTRMMALRGVGPHGRVLKEETVRDMARLTSKGARALSVPRMADDYPGMGTGEWCQRVDAQDNCTSVASIGAFGAYAWVDYEKGLYGVMFVRTSLARIMPEWNAIRAVVEQIG